MVDQEYVEFLGIWNQIMFIGLDISVVIAISITLFHFIRMITIKDLKGKYDYINHNEIRLFWMTCLFLAIGLALFLNTLVTETVQLAYFWFFVRLFVTMCISLIIGVIFNYTLKVYYPKWMERKLHKLRYKPRISPRSGNPMKLLSEEEEDVHLDEGMQAEEEVFSVDYDVWVDEETGYTKIEKYSGNEHALQCPSCNYYTLKVDREEIITSPTLTDPGELMKHYRCSYCRHRTRKMFTVSKLAQNESADQA